MYCIVQGNTNFFAFLASFVYPQMKFAQNTMDTESFFNLFLPTMIKKSGTFMTILVRHHP